jgi:GH25 family lysozyme M1 (1,4-beta-N-acetylmuramidase)
MKLLSVVSLTLVALSQASPVEKRAPPQGIDVSGWQPNINWATVKANGIQFAYIKATEGTGTSHLVSVSYSKQLTTDLRLPEPRV